MPEQGKTNLSLVPLQGAGHCSQQLHTNTRVLTVARSRHLFQAFIVVSIFWVQQTQSQSIWASASEGEVAPKIFFEKAGTSVNAQAASGEGASLPAIRRNGNGFRAYYTRLNYTPEWEKPWRVGRFADVVVTFPNSDISFVFWRGAGYIPNWVTENGIWYNNQFVERSSYGIEETRGCVEPMSDKQCRYSQVRIIQDNEARKIIHWRYAPVDVEYRHPFVDPTNGWYDWVDEYYFIYPDAIATRAATLYSTEPNAFADWQESIVVHAPGKSPEDDIDSTAVSIGNLEGDIRDYFWPDASRKTTLDGLPGNSCIQVVRLKSRAKPFIVLPPDEGLQVRIFDGHVPHSIFHQWDHWPVSQDKSWSRDAKDNSNPSHTSLTFWKGWRPVDTTENSTTMVMLHGMTEKNVGQLVPIAKAWLRPCEVEVKVNGCAFEGYDRTQRAYCFSMERSGKSGGCVFVTRASESVPLLNPVFVVRNWTHATAKVRIKGSGQKIEEIRHGLEYGIGGNVLVVWVKARISHPVEVSIVP
jgi:hypothetical protein